jgi:alkylation response protein AidB-like acyl-CoA dehydrogenase
MQPPRMQDKLSHEVFLQDEAKAIRREVREFVCAEVEPDAPAISLQEESRETFPRRIFDRMALQGLYAIPFPQGWGRGLQYPVLDTCVMLEELGYGSDSVAAVIDVHCILAGHVLMYGTDGLRSRYLKPLIAGEKVGCFATTEPEASTDLSLRSLKTVALKVDGGWRVTGWKRFITNACVADFVTALVVADGKLCEMVVDLKQAGVRVGEPDRKTGNRGQLTSDIYFDAVFVPEENLVGEPGRGLHIALGTLTYGRLGIAATGVGMAQRAFDECAHYMKQRTAFGKRLAEFQYWQFRLAEYAARIESARSLYQKAAYRKDTGVEFPEPEAAMAKFTGTQLAVDMARDAVQIFGGYGYMRQLSHDGSTYKVEELYRDSKITEIYEGANEIQKMLVAREIFGKEFAG